MVELHSGQSLASRFTLVRPLGRGGMGAVWLARDENLGSEVALKMVPPSATDAQITLLLHECRHARRLSHPNLVRVFDFYQEPEAVFITMEYVDGGDLSELRGRDPKVILETLLPLVEALQYAHDEGIVHRDLKSGNVFLDQAGRPRLGDFGIASVLRPGSEDLVLSGGGSQPFASPQQLAGEAASPADDIYGLGTLMTELLDASGSLPAGLRSLLDSMTSEDVSHRPADMRAVQHALEQILQADLEAPTVAPQVIRNEIRLSPPPRVAEVRPSVPAAGDRARIPEPAESSHHPNRWLTVIAFLGLAAVAFGVFVLLPKWVENRESAAPPVAQEDSAKDTAVISEEGMETEDAGSGQLVEAAASRLPESGPAEIEPVEPEPPAPEPALQSTPQQVAGEKPRASQSGVVSPPQPRVDPRARDFATAMGDGLEALEVDDAESAKKSFEQALKLMPESAEAADGLARAERQLRLAAIRDHQSRARSFEDQELWHEAKREYAAALALDSTLRFAREGETRAAARATLDDELEFHLGHTSRLSEDSVLRQARSVLESARSIEPSTDKLRGQIERLQQAIEIATTPVRVVLVSDNLTQVVVYKVGRMGTFERRTLDLRPGTYTVVGTREGYRDVRRQLEVAPEGQNEPLTVRCEEEI